ncbi:MAG TPA: addiction module protein [Thermoanaerobaculia bacterium]|jgi:putative addiction module component (TIGR02574 family)
MRTLDAIRDEALQLNEEDRGVLADALWESFLTPEERELQEEWLDEAERRIADLEAGRSRTIPAEEVFARLRTKYSAKDRSARSR